MRDTFKVIGATLAAVFLAMFTVVAAVVLATLSLLVSLIPYAAVALLGWYVWEYWIR